MSRQVVAVGQHADVVRLTVVGDLCLADSAYCIGNGTRSMVERLGLEVPANRLQEILGASDLSFANLESVMSDEGANKWSLAASEMRGSPAHIDLLQRGGLNVLNVANNHIYQHGPAAYLDTIDRLESAGISVVGHLHDGGPNVASLCRNGQHVHFIGFSMRPEQYQIHETDLPYAMCLDGRTIVESVCSLSASLDGHIVCSLHWGYEYLDTPSREQQELARALIDAGASAVVGHHPHVLQGIERYGRGVILYSLGNFVFDLREPVTLDTMAVDIILDQGGVRDYSVQPLVIDENFLPRRPEAPDAGRIAGHIQDLSRSLTEGPLPAAGELLEREAVCNRESSWFTYRYFARNLYRYNPLMAFQSVLRALLRRLGLAHNP